MHTQRLSQSCACLPVHPSSDALLADRDLESFGTATVAREFIGVGRYLRTAEAFGALFFGPRQFHHVHESQSANPPAAPLREGVSEATGETR